MKADAAKTSAAKPATVKTADAAAAAKPVVAKDGATPAATKTAAKKSTKKVPKPAVTAATLTDVSDTVADVGAWIMASGDNRELPFAIIDKDGAQILLFDDKGVLKGRAPVLIGSSVGDLSSEGVGDRELEDIPMGERTTPGGRFVVGYAPAKGGGKVLWVDYATAISIHALPTDVPKKEKRPERMASKTPNDNRITHGCINVTSSFYKTVRATFKKDGVFYIMPDETPLQIAFPGFQPPARFASLAE